jgi:hypothetical protein
MPCYFSFGHQIQPALDCLTNSAPQSGSTWSGFSQLAYAANGQPAIAKSVYDGRCSAAAVAAINASKTVGSNSATFSMISNAYPADFGRPATQAELNYWASVPLTDSRVQTRVAIQQNDIAYLRGNAAERQRMILQAYGQTWNITLPIASPEFKYWDSVGQLTYTDVQRALAQIKNANPNYRPGQNPPMKFNMPPRQYNLASTDVPLLDAFALIGALYKKIGDDALGVVNAPLGGVISIPPDPPLPAMTSPRPPPSLGGPFVLASTPYQHPDLSFCLDTGSFNPGSPVVAALCHGGNSQLFATDASNHIFMTNNPQGTLCLDSGDKPWPGDPRYKQLVLNPCTPPRRNSGISTPSPACAPAHPGPTTVGVPTTPPLARSRTSALATASISRTAQ